MSDCRRYNQSGQYITTRVIAHKFRDEKFVSVSYNELDENEEGEEVNFVAADEARWTPGGRGGFFSLFVIGIPFDIFRFPYSLT